MSDKPNLLILGYYDGPTSGVIATENSCAYFKVLAWDRHQDMRLFATIPVSRDLLSRLWSLSETPSATSGIWRAKSSDASKKASELIRSMQLQLSETRSFFLSFQVDSEVKHYVDLRDELRDWAVKQSSVDHPGSLENLRLEF